VFNWWNLFVRLADPDHHREAITSRPLLLQAIGRQTATPAAPPRHHNCKPRRERARPRDLYPLRPLLRATAQSCGAVDGAPTLVPDPQQGAEKIYTRTTLVPPRQLPAALPATVEGDQNRAALIAELTDLR
jgi:hypothetical protein